MATATMATAAGAAAALLYYTLNRKLRMRTPHDDENSDDAATHAHLGIDRVSHRLIQAPGTWLETISTLSETLRFTYSETLGKWPIGDLAFGINFLLKRQVGFFHVSCSFSTSLTCIYFVPSLNLENPIGTVLNMVSLYQYLCLYCNLLNLWNNHIAIKGEAKEVGC